MTVVRLLADDLTGALDTAAEFVGLCGPFDVTWADSPATPDAQSLAIDSGTRERSKADSVEIVGRLAPQLQGGTIAYKKVDSLLRGAWAAELGACLRGGDWASCVVAPAFDYQGRRTVGGQRDTGGAVAAQTSCGGAARAPAEDRPGREQALDEARVATAPDPECGAEPLDRADRQRQVARLQEGDEPGLEGLRESEGIGEQTGDHLALLVCQRALIDRALAAASESGDGILDDAAHSLLRSLSQCSIPRSKMRVTAEGTSCWKRKAIP